MVSFNDLPQQEGPEGPCRLILNREDRYIREMVDKSFSNTLEYVGHVVLIDGKTGTTEMLEGDESSISQNLSSQSMFDAMSMAKELKVSPGSANVNEYDRYKVHTHPKGFAGLSLTDIKSFVDDIVKGGSYSDATLVATRTDRGISLGGLYIDGEMTDDGLQRLQSSLSVVNTQRIPMTVSEQKTRLLTAIEETNINGCRTLFP